MPKWIIIEHPPLEYLQMTYMVVAEVGMVFGCDPTNPNLKHHRFCAFINVDRRWVKN
jgi:hypothetical protein